MGNYFIYDIKFPNQLNIQFTSNLITSNVINSIKLISTDSIGSNEIDVNFTSLNEEVNSINITIPSDIELGNYIIKFSYLNNDIIIIPKIIIYEDSFSIKQDSYFSINSFRLSNITIPFEGEYRSGQVKKIYFINDNNRDKIDIT